MEYKKNIFYTKQDLIDTGLKLVGAYISSDTKVGEYFLQPSVISMWDWKDYSDSYTYFDGGIQLVVHLCHKTDDVTTKFENLKKDLSNVPFKEIPMFEGTMEQLNRL